jgi:oxygen-independent coproporphyrinogen-3 oxidase
MPALVDALGIELDNRSTYLATKELSSIYIGGGTPSLLSEAQIAFLFEKISKHFGWQKNAEITLEANPDDISLSTLSAWRNLGINRLSIGLQSFDESELKWMNRAHTASQSIDALKLAQDKGWDNISIDLIYGSKFQDMAKWEHTLQTVVRMQVSHVSAYNLTIEKRTALGVSHVNGLEPPIDDSLSSEQFALMSQMLTDAGFIHYEISNFAKPGREAVHNSSYWKQEPYLGIGPSAHSFDGRSRQWNVRNNNIYIKALNEGGVFFEREELDVRTRYNEYVLTRLRTIWGCDISEMERLFGGQMVTFFLKGVSVRANLFNRQGDIYSLTPEGRLFADGIASDLFFV